ncbi:MAG TPA: hypothetical protein VHQ01_07835, partial [Pyrinomonadaceae bacterium]|nr:hypothetical protein [Pyrinomonadaceae bacterium]
LEFYPKFCSPKRTHLALTTDQLFSVFCFSYSIKGSLFQRITRASIGPLGPYDSAGTKLALLANAATSFNRVTYFSNSLIRLSNAHSAVSFGTLLKFSWRNIIFSVAQRALLGRAALQIKRDIHT